VIGALDAATLTRWHEALSSSSRELALELPKFELSVGGSIKDKLSALGIKQAFTEGADFSRMGSGRFAISDVFHKTFIRVDEKGTEAAAATGVVMAPTESLPPAPIPFVVDHPFAYYLVDKTNGRVLFIGVVNDPTAAS
jgi:serpin B